MEIAGHPIGVCSWSLHPKDTADLVERMRVLGLSHLQLGVLNLVNADDKRKHHELGILRSANITITATMIGFPGEDYSTIAAIKKTGGYVQDDQWDLRRQITQHAAKLTAELGVKLLSAHIGFVPPSSDERYPTMVERINTLGDDLAATGITLLMETGQESAAELLQFLNDLRVRNVKVNFDPANMLLYGAGDPIEAVNTLGRHIAHVHIKDAIMSEKPGVDWGREVPFGSGQVPPREFLNALHGAGFRGPLVVEREAGENRMQDIQQAVETLKQAAV